MAQSLLFEVGGGSSLDRGLLGMEGAPGLSAPSHDTVAVQRHPGPLIPCLYPRTGSIFTTLISEGPYQEEPKTRAYPRLCRGVGPQTQGLLCRAGALHPVEILGG